MNVLSEIAGLAVATLATLLFLNKAVEDWNARRWRSAKESAVVSAVYDARHLAGWLAELHGVGDAPDELEPMGQIGFDRLVAELRETRNRLQGVRSAARFFRDPWLAGHPGHHGRSSANRPFSASHTTNPLNHAEALWDPTLQAQVVSILSRLRAPTVSGQAVTRITPYPVRQFPAPHTVTASDAITGAPITTGSVTVRDTFGGVALQAPLGTAFTFAFRGRRTIITGPDGRRDVETVFPTVEANLPVPYGKAGVDTGQG